ncbi:uncharacterized protein ACA1_247650 [Acanthamoeba castellanii str. Neff]|uniref:Uncharacterized protein n=1 Tax=Acanthamoeba castellanii (strain ATCC 30010 / Neff) TaxID=1257118 RepID=L8GKI6_ACACF|nr:uncharacterized protein ACA1_247650 [Acanthamoeba castellanii str. Neff]ELR13537.1 hypothetical protein ACA1_247650 [Acanthamoeba castellanii str. Neff]
MSSAPPKQRIQTVQDFAITSQLRQDHLAVKIAPLLTDFFLSIYRSCLNYAEAVMAESGDVVDPIDHFARAGAGSVSPALMATLPTKRKIVGELIDEAGTVFLSDPALIAKPRRAIESAAIWRGGGGTADGANLFSPAMRSNANYIFLTKAKSGVLREKIYKNWGSSVPNARVFNQIMDAATLDYSCLVIDNKNNSSSRISDSFARFKADYDLAESPFKMGGAPFWAFGATAGIGEDEMDNDEGGNNVGDDEIDAMERALRNIGPKTKVRVRRVTRDEDDE